MLLPLTAFAADVPASKCVTTATKNSHNAAVARMEADIKPFLGKPEANASVAAYREAIATAWDAMEEPYCGYGSYGAASAVKSFGKSVVRAQSAFAAASAGWKKSPLAKAIAATTNAAAIKPAAPMPSPTPATKKATTSISRKKIPSGLTFGMRSDNVLALQERLNAAGVLNAEYLTGYFGQKTKEAVLAYQASKKIISTKASPGAGLVGPKTLASLNEN